MGNKRRRYRTQLRVQMKYAPVRNAGARLSRAIDILLRSAAKNTTTSEEGINAQKEEPPRQVATEDTLTGGGEEGDPHE